MSQTVKFMFSNVTVYKNGIGQVINPWLAYPEFEINFSMYYKSSKRIAEAELILLHKNKNAFVAGCYTINTLS